MALFLSGLLAIVAILAAKADASPLWVPETIGVRQLVDDRPEMQLDRLFKSDSRPNARLPKKSANRLPKRSVFEYLPVKQDVVMPVVANGLAPVISQIQTKQPIVFLTIDDGAVKRAADINLVNRYRIKATLFLADIFISENPAFFKGFTATGSLVENHSVSHQNLTLLSYEDQKQEICDEADRQFEQFGRRPILFRPPGGDYNQDTQRAAADCGLQAVVQWTAKANGGSMQYQVGDRLRPGDIVLMHFRPEFPADMEAFINAVQSAGLHTELLEDWFPDAS